MRNILTNAEIDVYPPDTNTTMTAEYFTRAINDEITTIKFSKLKAGILKPGLKVTLNKARCELQRIIGAEEDLGFR